jgi:hypothetical protein
MLGRRSAHDMTLAELAAWEARLQHALPDGGTFEERVPIIEGEDLPAQWSQVFLEYVHLLADEDQGAEALRRALFLTWYLWNEPPALTGIFDLDAQSQRVVLEAVDRLMRCDHPDAELCSMLRGYGPGLPFDQHPDLLALNAYVNSIEGQYSPDAPLGPMVGRGAMGTYWLSRNDLPNKALQTDRPSAGG